MNFKNWLLLTESVSISQSLKKFKNNKDFEKTYNIAFKKISSLPPNVPEKLKRIASERLEKWTHVSKIPGVIKYMNSEDWHPTQWNSFLKYTKTLDASRNQDFFKLMPMFLEFDNA